MSFATALPVADPPAAGGATPGGALPGRKLLGFVQRFMQTGMAIARHVNRIARQRLEGQDLARLAPAAFNPTWTHHWVIEAVAWTAALRERLRALAGPRALAPGLPKGERAPQARVGAAGYRLPEGAAEAVAGEWHNWPEMAKPLRIGPNGVAEAAQRIAGLSDRAVVSVICDNLRKAADQLGAEADIARITALEEAALALCPEADAADSTEAEAADVGRAEGAPATPAADPPSDQAKAKTKTGHDPPPD